MTVSITNPKQIYNGDGSTKNFDYSFAIFDETDLEVYRTTSGVDNELILGTDFTNTGGTTEYSGQIQILGTAPAADEKITIISNIPLTQPLDYEEYGAFSAESHEQGLDRLVRQNQQLQEQINRSVALPVSSNVSGLSLPEPEEGKVPKWSGNALINSTYGVDEVVAQTAADAAQVASDKTAVDTAKTDTLTAQGLAETARDQAVAAAASNNLPTLASGDEGKLIRVNPTFDGYEFDPNVYVKDTDIGSTVQAYDANLVSGGTSQNLTAGYTTDLYTITAPSSQATYNVDITQECIQDITIDGDWTLGRGASTKAGRAIIRATVDATGGYVFATSNIKVVSGTFDTAANAVNYVEYTQWNNTSDAIVSISQGV